jgi:ubiquinol-cytochrome c reductase cytochrome b subunit
MTWLRNIGRWFDARLKISASIMPMLTHPIPRGAAGPMGWWYIFGSASFTLLIVQILTGIALALVYVPAADNAYDTLTNLDYVVPLGWFLRALHYYAGSGMMVMVLLHMTQVFLHGAFKYPRELTWVVGVILLLCTLGMFFTGQVMRWDPDAYWGVAVGASMAGRVPLLGPALVDLLLGGPILGADTLSRFFALHVFVIPGALLGFLAIHLWLVLKCGISAPPVPGQKVDPKTYDAEYEEEVKRGVPFLGEAFIKDALVSCLAVITVVVIAAIVGPKGPTGLTNPALGGDNPRPEWPFLWLFGLLSLSPPAFEIYIMLVLPGVLVAALMLVPFVSNRGERAPSRRPVSVVAVVVIATLLGILTYQGATSPWSPVMTAWSGDPVPISIVERSTPLELQGALVFQYKSCRNCHALEGLGGHRGPDLTAVGTRLTRNDLIDQVSNGTPGGGNMPACGKQISPAEMTALVEFLTSLRPEGQPPARTPVASPVIAPVADAPGTPRKESP